MADRGQAIASVEEIAAVADRDELRRQRCRARADFAVAAAALHQSRTVLAALQPPGAGGGRQRAAIRCSSGCASCRSRPTTSTNSSWCASPASRARCAQGIATQSPDGLTPGRAARAHRRGGRRSSPATSRSAGGSCATSSPTPASCWSTAPDLQEGRARLARGSFPHARLPGADAARDRSGASVPVHSQSRLLDRAAARARQATARR